MDKKMAEELLLTQTENSCVDRFTLDDLMAVDVSELEELEFLDGKRECDYNYVLGVRQLVNCEGVIRYYLDDFVPKAGSVYLKPSFAGRQVVMGMVNGSPMLSNGVWFSCYIENKRTSDGQDATSVY